jgi:p-hydroxybenzoate 3-monooxygenase
MFLALQLYAADIDVVVLERRSRAYVEGRVRAGVLEPVTTRLMSELGIDARLQQLGLAHGGVNLCANDALGRIDLRRLTGNDVTVYGQQEVMRDLFDAAEARGITVVWEADDVSIHGVQSNHPCIRYSHEGRNRQIDCDFVCGCDGQHGVSHAAIPAGALQKFERVYPFGWLGVLADVPPANEELIYASHPHGFALASMRSPTRSRYYLQCALDEDLDAWPDERFWDEICLRFGNSPAVTVTRGPSFEKSIAPLRSLVTEPMRYGQLFLLGDAAHIVPPTGAKGLNLAVSDSILLSEAFRIFYAQGDVTALGTYSARALARVWKAERFSWWLTSITHRFPDMDDFDRQLQSAELSYLFESEAAQKTLAENYVGLPLVTR